MYGTFEHGVLLLSNKRWGTIKFKIEPAEWGVLPINIKSMGPRGLNFGLSVNIGGLLFGCFA